MNKTETFALALLAFSGLLAGPAAFGANFDQNQRYSVKSTTMTDAARQARINAGRPDPMAANQKIAGARTVNMASLTSGGIKKSAGHRRGYGGLVVPPPPVGCGPVYDGITGAAVLSGNRSENLGPYVEPPPERILDQVKVIAVMDDKAVLEFPSLLSLKNNWPRTVTMSAGEHFEKLSVISVAPNHVTLEEDHQRLDKTLDCLH